jgi:hypothetical protein
MRSRLPRRRLVAALLPALFLAGGAVPAHAQELDLTSSNNPSNAGEDVTFTVTAHYGCADGSNVWIDIDGNTVASGSPLNGDSVVYTTSALAIGDHQVEAHLSAIGPPGVNCSAQSAMTETVLPAATPAPTAPPPPPPTSAPPTTSAPPPPVLTPHEPPTPEPSPAVSADSPSSSPSPVASADPTSGGSPDPKPAVPAGAGSGTLVIGVLALGATALLTAIAIIYRRRRPGAPTG